jgi:flagellar motor switch protein FliN/FliY
VERLLIDISNVTVEICVRLGQTKIRLKDLLSMSAGSIVELNHIAGTPFELYINDKLFGYGELVVVNGEQKGIRITQIIKNS